MSLLSKRELEVRAISVRARDLVYVRHHLEASEGIGFLIAKKGGDALLVAPYSRARELDEFISDMKTELGLLTRELLHDDEAIDVAL